MFVSINVDLYMLSPFFPPVLAHIWPSSLPVVFSLMEMPHLLCWPRLRTSYGDSSTVLAPFVYAPVQPYFPALPWLVYGSCSAQPSLVILKHS